MTNRMESLSALIDSEALASTLGVPDPGNQFEAELIDTHLHYLRQGLAFVFKLALPKGVGGWRGWFPRCKTPFDFAGILADGRPVAFDVKVRDVGSERGARWRFSDALAHQVTALRLVEAWGGVAFFLVGLEERGLLVKAAMILPSALEPRKSIDLGEAKHVARDDRGRWDWLATYKLRWFWSGQGRLR